MNHPDIELLTQFALDDPLALDAATLVHISDCEHCMSEVQQVQRVVAAVDALETPAEQPAREVAEAVPAPRTTVDDAERGWLFGNHGGDAERGWLFGNHGGDTEAGSFDGHQADEGRR